MSSKIFDKQLHKSESHLEIPSGKSFGAAKFRKIISVNYMKYVNDANDLEKISVNSSNSYQTHKRSHLNLNKMNIFDQD